MSFSLCSWFTPFISLPLKTPRRIPLSKPANPISISSLPKISNSRFPINCYLHGNSGQLASTPANPRWESWLATAASLYPLYVTVGGTIACLRPSTFSWFVKAGPTSYSLTLGFIMLAMGITLELKDLINLFKRRPLSVSFVIKLLFCDFDLET